MVRASPLQHYPVVVYAAERIAVPPPRWLYVEAR